MAAPTAATNWLGHGSFAAWQKAHFASLGKTVPKNAPKAPAPARTSGPSINAGTPQALNKYTNAHNANVNSRYGGNQNPTYEQQMANNKSARWYNRSKLIKDQGLVDKGYQYFTGNPGTSEADMRKAGYVKNSEAGGVGGNSANSWYLPPAKKSGGGATGGGGGVAKASSNKKNPSHNGTGNNSATDKGGTSARTGYHYNPDKNANLKEATIWGNEDNTRRIEEFQKWALDRTNDFNAGTRKLTDDTTGELDRAFANYDKQMKEHSANMGTADQDIHTRNRGQAYAGLDSGFSSANDDLQAQLARRGMSNSGIGAKAMGDLAQARMGAGASAGVNAYTSAIDMSDARRTGRMNTIGTLYGAEQGNINNNYQMGMGQLGQAYGSEMSVRGQSMQNGINNNQQRIANLMGYSQLGRGMAGMSQNYLQQAGTGYGNIAGQAGQTAIGIGGLNNSYNSTMQQAQAKKNEATTDMFGTALGVAGKAMMFSDERLKKNIIRLETLPNGINVCKWEWTKEAKKIVGNSPTVGVIAQQVLDIKPEAVKVNKDTGHYMVDYSQIFGGIAS